MRTFRCPVDGCAFRGTRAKVRKHAERPHVTCACGWVGPNFNGHRGVRIRFAIEAAERAGGDTAAAARDERQRHRRVEP